MKTLFLFISLMLAWSASAQKANDKNEAAKVPAKREYTEKEFTEEVNSRVVEKLKKLQGDGVVQFSKELLKKEEAIKLRELELKKREDQLGVNIRDFETRLTEFRNKQQKLIGCIDDSDKMKSKRIDHMVDVIAGMRPQSAADVLSVQETDISVQILGLLQPDKVSKIFNLMDKEISARLQKQYMNMKR